jgi:hypothetical protein
MKLVDELIQEVEEKRGQCEEKRWFRVTKEGEKVFLMDALLGQLNRYARIGDIAIQHHPEIVALAWSGFRLLLQVRDIALYSCVYTCVDMCCSAIGMTVPHWLLTY